MKKKEKCCNAFDFCRIPIIISIYVIFLVIGAIIITRIEAEGDKRLRNQKRQQLLNVYKKYNISLNDQRIREFLRAAYGALEVDAMKLNKMTQELESRWDFTSSLFFTATLVTTIGYGDRYPMTGGGRSFCIIYALIGIPFTGYLVTILCTLFANLIKRTESAIKKIRKIKRIENKNSFKRVDEEDEIKTRTEVYQMVRAIQVGIATSIFLIFIWLLPSLIIMISNDWNFETAIYFCFITISTIGLGDVTPSMTIDPLQLEDEKNKLGSSVKQISIICYIIISLTSITVIISLATSIWKTKKLKKKWRKEAKSFREIQGHENDAFSNVTQVTVVENARSVDG
ncbi:potassium channel subfamily K member 1-like isoform X2 [Clytia hemisphaerica]|uniref:Potassium channel domain-containing protein n=1 Tax=Clytia hemisphaerica TaxID=252671 RepID=A0A7M6DKS4_9CNID|eukprot:TCONS_00018855-protein